MAFFRFCAILALALAIGMSGCTKKTTKIETPPPAPVAEPEPQPEPEPTFEPSDEDVFVAADMDAEMRELLVPIYFSYDQWELKPEEVAKLERIAPFLSEHPDKRILIEGHADERGTNEYNIGLGENRAKTVKQYLVSYGISSSRFETTSYGRERPATPNCPDEACHAKNRRVEWVILK